MKKKSGSGSRSRNKKRLEVIWIRNILLSDQEKKKNSRNRDVPDLLSNLTKCGILTCYPEF